MNKFYNIVFKVFIIIMIIAILIFCVSGSYASENIDHLAYVVALALDSSSTENLKLTIQLANPSSSSSSDSGSSSQSSSSVLSTVECSSIEAGINLLNSYISRNINLSHCKAIIISESLASNDISTYIYDLSNNVEVSSHANIIITKSEANEFLKMSNPVLESFSARYYEIATSSSKYTGYTKATTLIDFFSATLDTYKEATAILGNINTDSTHAQNLNGDVTNKDSTYVAGQTPIISENNVESMGIVVFKGSKAVGELNGLENICHMIVSGNLKSCNIQVANPNNNSNNNIDINLQLAKKPKCSIDLINGFPYINLNINLNIRIISANKNSDYSDNNVIESLENEINSYMKELITDYLYKMSKEYNSDIDGFGTYAVSKFKTLNEWNEFDWLNNFENSFFNVSINSKIKSGYNFIKA